MILAGDVGGTNSRLALFDRKLSLVAEKTYPSQGFPALEPVLDKFVKDTASRPERACIGIAGPVKRGICHTTNLPWVVDSRALARHLNIPACGLINDLEALAWGISALKPEDLYTVNAGDPEALGNQAVVALGTGLGQAGLYWNGRWHCPWACEGGHSGFTPRNDLEIDLLRFAMAEQSRPDAEYFLSGPGLFTIYRFLRETGRGQEPAWLAEELGSGDPPAIVSRLGVEGSPEICVQALDVFLAIFGSETANAALKLMATGGIYLGGGIVPKILPQLRTGGFLEAFLNAGAMGTLLEGIPVRAILNERTALLGSAVHALGGPV